MAEIIEFSSTPLTRMKKQLEERNARIAQLEEQVQLLTQKINLMASLNEMIRLQLNDLGTNINGFVDAIATSFNSIKDLTNKLPR